MPKKLKYLIYFKIIAVFVSCFSPFMHPHIIRQTDTMGVAFRYWMRWTMETDLMHPLLPAVLTAGDKYGISPMEFPLLNLLFAPVFSVGLYPGRILALIFCMAFYLGLTYFYARAWKDTVLYGVKLSHVVWVGLIFSVSQMYWGRFMPDYLAYSLVGIAAALSFNKTNYWSFVLAALGLLIKPPAIIALGFLLLRPRNLPKNLIWIIPAFVICLLYYTKGIAHLKEVSDMPAYFAVQFRNPITSLGHFFSEPAKIMRLIFKDIFTSYTLIILGGFGVYRLWKTKEVKLKAVIGIMILQVLGIAVLDGEHAFIHDYYFIGLSLSAGFFFLYFLQNAHRGLVNFVLVILAFYQIDRAQYEGRMAFVDNKWKSCDKVLASGVLDNRLRIDSPKTNYPTVGLCLGKIQNTDSSDYRAWFDEEKLILIRKLHETGP